MNRPLIPFLFVALTGMLVSAEIHDAVERGDSATVLKLINQDRNVIHQKDKAGDLPLHLAALKGQVEIIQTLLKAGAAVNAKGFDDMTPLHYAAKAGSEEACRLLLESGADRNALNWLSQTPAKLARAWVAHVIQTFTPKVSGAQELFEAVAAADLPKVNALITASPALLTAHNDLGLTALLLAAKQDHLPLLKMLLVAGADVNARDRTGNSALHFAYNHADVDASRLLLQFKIKPSREEEFNELLDICVTAASYRGIKKVMIRFPVMMDMIKDQVKKSAMEAAAVAEAADLVLGGTGEITPQKKPGGLSSAGKGLEPWFAALMNSGISVEPGNLLAYDVPPEKQSRHLEIARLLVESGVNINHPRDGCGSALSFAAMSDTPDAVKALLRWGAKADLPDMDGLQALASAILAEQPETIRLLLEAGADPLFKAGEYLSALALACKDGQYKTAQTLLAAVKDRARLTQTDEPLTVAVKKGHAEIARLLVEAGMPVNLRSHHDSTLLHEAVRYDSVEITQLLLNAGADVNARDKAGYTPLHNAAEYNKPLHIPLLIQHGAKLEAATIENLTPAMIASEGNAAALKVLLKAGARIDGVGSNGFNALHNAASVGSPEAIKALLKAGIPVDGLSRTSNRTALAMTATGGLAWREGLKNKPRELNGMPLAAPRYGTAADYLAAVEILLAAGADVSLADKEGFTPLHHAVTADEVPVVRLLLAKGARVDAVTHKELTPLHLAAGAASPDMLEFLLSRGAVVDAVQNNQPSKYTPLMWAVDAGKVDNLKLLLQHGADPKCRVFDKKASALHMAAMLGHVAIAQVLVAAGVGVDVVDDDGFTPLSVAAAAGHKEVAEWLIQHGADINARAKNGDTPSTIATKTRHAAISQLLRQHGAK